MRNSYNTKELATFITTTLPRELITTIFKSTPGIQMNNPQTQKELKQTSATLQQQLKHHCTKEITWSQLPHTPNNKDTNKENLNKLIRIVHNSQTHND